MYSRSPARFNTILKMALACLAVPNVMPDSHSCTSLALMSSSAVRGSSAALSYLSRSAMRRRSASLAVPRNISDLGFPATV